MVFAALFVSLSLLPSPSTFPSPFVSLLAGFLTLLMYLHVVSPPHCLHLPKAHDGWALPAGLWVLMIISSPVCSLDFDIFFTFCPPTSFPISIFPHDEAISVTPVVAFHHSSLSGATIANSIIPC